MIFQTPVKRDPNTRTRLDHAVDLGLTPAQALAVAVCKVRAHYWDKRADEGGLVVACVDGAGARARFFSLGPGAMHGWVVGRHECCALRILDPHSGAALRHSLLWALHRSEGIELRVMDLRSARPTHILGLGTVESARVSGTVGLMLGEAYVFVIPVRPGARVAAALPRELPDITLVDGPVDAKERQLSLGFADARADARAASFERSTVRPLGPIADFAAAYRDTKGRGLTVRFEVEQACFTPLHLSWKQLEAGALFGRYPRCHPGLHDALPSSVSRVHLGLFAYHDYRGSRVVAMDLASTCGVSLAQRPVQCCVLREGMRLVLAEGVSMRVLGLRA